MNIAAARVQNFPVLVFFSARLPNKTSKNFFVWLMRKSTFPHPRNSRFGPRRSRRERAAAR